MMKLTKQFFEDISNQTFDIYFQDDQGLSCQLIEINNGNSEQSTSFSLLFQTFQNTVFVQNTYALKHKELKEEIALFLVPIASDEAGVVYEATFN